jgi:type I restriction enzyme R subunit
MWLTGFDSPSMHTMYVDKPMRGAPLMQAIARVNRTFADKPSGLVVDYLGIAEDLKSALADYTKRDRDNEEMGEDLRERALPALLEEHEVLCAILHAYPWRDDLAAGGDRAFVRALSGAVDWLLGQHPGPADAPCTKQTPCARCRFLAHARKLRSLYAICVPDEQALAIREDVAFLDAVRGQLAKEAGETRVGGDPAATMEAAIKQIVSDHVSGAGVLDIYAEAGMQRPDLSLIDDGFIDAFRRSDRPNLQLELLKRLLADEIKAVSRRNVVQGKKFSEMLQASLLRYQNRSIDAAAVVAELVTLAQEMKAEHDRGRASGLSQAEIAFYDAIASDRSAAGELGDDELRAIAHDLVGILRRDAKTDWNVKEQVRAKMRAAIKRLLLQHGYPPEREAQVTELVFAQAEALTALAA